MSQVVDLFEQAKPETREMVLWLLELDRSDRLWNEQLGPVFTQVDAARLLGKSEQATSKDPRLVRFRTRSGRIAYPIWQFNGRQPLPGVAEVVTILTPVVEPLTIASWLTGRNRSLGDRRPVDALREGDLDKVATVAQWFANAAG